MSSATNPSDLQHTGILLVNLGTPDAPTEEAVRRYLKEFLSDRRVVSIPPIIWQPILNLFVLRSRPAKSAHAYQQVWTDEGSPLLAFTRAQTEELQARFNEKPFVSSVVETQIGENSLSTSLEANGGVGGGVGGGLESQPTVDFAMRYGNPSFGDRLAAMRNAGVNKLLIAPLYPQYCTATTATAEDEIVRVLEQMKWQPEVIWLRPYFADPLYIDALAQSVATALDGVPFVPERTLVSFHGMPERTRIAGDPYHSQCLATASLLSKRLATPLDVTFQSRFGAETWLQPYTDKTLIQMAQEGVKSVAILAPGFSVDCLETLEELAIRGKEQFLAAGGEQFAYLPCLNASPPGMDMLEALVRRALVDGETSLLSATPSQ